MSCNRIRHLVFLWVDRDREALPRERVARHLDECPSCRDRAQQIERCVLLLRSRCRRETVPDHLVQRIRIRIQGE